MRILPKSFRALLLTVVVLAVVPLALAVPNRFTTIDYPGAAQTYVWGINTAGDVVGSYVDSSGVEHGYMLHDGTFTSLDYQGASWTQAYGITPQGDVVGQYGRSGDPATHGFLLKSGSFSAVEIAGPTDLGSASSMPFSIMPDGTIVGCYHESTSTGAIAAGSMRGFILKGADVTFAPVNTMNTGVNAAGDAVGYGAGYTSGAAADHGYLLSKGAFTWFSVPNSVFTRARGIAANGDIVGIYQDTAAKKFHGFLYRHGAFSTIDLPGASATRPTTMNAIGDIAGYYTDAKGNHGFLLRKTGWWWNPDQPGTGFMMEQQGNKMSVSAFVYSYDGTPTWLSASGPVVNGTFSALAHAYASGQTLSGPYQPAQDQGGQGVLTIRFTDSGSAQLSWVQNPWMFSSMMLQRFGFTGGPMMPGQIENGWWWNPAEPGRSFAIEAQDDNLFIVGSTFDDGGRPTWFLSHGIMTDATHYSGVWTQYGQGPSLLGFGGSPMVMNSNAGTVQVSFNDAQNGTLTLPNGRQIAIVRQSY